MRVKLLTYNILHGGKGRETFLLRVLQHAQADVVLLQEVEQPSLLTELAHTLNMQMRSTNGIGLLSKYPIDSAQIHRTFPYIHDTVLEARIAFPSGIILYLFGVHPVAYPGSFLDIWRSWQLHSVRKYALSRQNEACIVAGDFNAVAPLDNVLTHGAPLIMQFIYWLQGGKIYRATIRRMLEMGFIDCYRYLHPKSDGITIPTASPKLRLDYIFASPFIHSFLRASDVLTEPEATGQASDHYPVWAEFELPDKI